MTEQGTPSKADLLKAISKVKSIPTEQSNQPTSEQMQGFLKTDAPTTEGGQPKVDETTATQAQEAFGDSKPSKEAAAD